MAGKNANGEGSIVKRADGRYMARVTLPGSVNRHQACGGINCIIPSPSWCWRISPV